MWLTVLIVLACIQAMVIWAGVLLARLRNRSSTPPSPTPSTTPTPTSDDLALKMMTAMNEAHKEQMKEMRGMVSDLALGRESQTPTGTQETWQMQSARQIDYDYDSTPLSPGIDAVLAREEQETEQARILRERAELQERLIELQAELDHSELETSSEPGPWSNGDSPRHARND